MAGMTEPINLEEIEAEYLRQCGPCDYGLVEYGCNCPTGDPRSVISRLIDEVRRMRHLQSEEQRQELVLMAKRHLEEIIRLRVGLKRLATYAAAEERTVLWFADALQGLLEESERELAP